MGSWERQGIAAFAPGPAPSPRWPCSTPPSTRPCRPMPTCTACRTTCTSSTRYGGTASMAPATSTWWSRRRVGGGDVDWGRGWDLGWSCREGGHGKVGRLRLAKKAASSTHVTLPRSCNQEYPAAAAHGSPRAGRGAVRTPHTPCLQLPHPAGPRRDAHPLAP